MASLWAFRFLLFYIGVLCVQPQNRFTFMYPLHIADLCIMAAVGLHFISATQEGKPFIRPGPATITAFLLMFFSLASLYMGPWQTSSAWNSNIDLIFKNCLVLILVEAMAFTVQRVWAVQACLMLSTLWWVKGGLRLIASGSTYAGDRIQGPAVSMIENPNGFAYLMTVMIPLYLYFFQKSTNKYLRYGFLVLVLASVYIVLQTGSRTGLLALITVGLFLLPKYGAQHKVALVVGGAAIFFIFATTSESNMNRFRSIPESIRNFVAGVDASADTGQMDQDAQSAWERRMKNKHTWQLILDFPLFGVGVSASDELVFEKYPYAAGQVHNEILYAGRQMGFIGIGLYLSLMYCIFSGGRRVQRATASWWSSAADLGWTFKMQALVFMVGGFFSPIPWNPIYLVLAGSASALVLNLRGGAFSREVPSANPVSI